MRLRYVIAIIIGAYAGFIGTFIADFFEWKPAHMTYPHEVVASIKVEHGLAQNWGVNGVAWWHALRVRACLFDWLLQRGDVAMNAVAIVALLGASYVFTEDRFEQLKTTKEPGAGR